jgi:ABC-type maltose transport system permease subunit
MNLLIIRFQQLSLSDEALLQQDAGTISENAGYGFSRYDELFRRSELRSPMTLLIMFGGFMAAVAAMTYIEVRRIRKKLTPK